MAIDPTAELPVVTPGAIHTDEGEVTAPPPNGEEVGQPRQVRREMADKVACS